MNATEADIKPAAHEVNDRGEAIALIEPLLIGESVLPSNKWPTQFSIAKVVQFYFATDS